ncbi:hypothetical protein [Clostridium sp. BJN0013]|uniref:hypothetical protein n=1 Tax=Clostridium sp. BJN0013 TaxID=3236840 RepID=UPI0034C64ECF
MGLVMDSFPGDNCISFKNSSPVQSVESIKYYDTGIQAARSLYLILVTILLTGTALLIE